MSKADDQNKAAFAALTHKQKVEAVVQMICETGRQHGNADLPSLLTGMEAALMLIRAGLTERVIKAGCDSMAQRFGLGESVMEGSEIWVSEDHEGN